MPGKVTPLLALRRDLAQLEERFRTALDSYEELRASCEARVSRWEWANGAAYSLDPLFFLDRDIGVGRISSSPPRNPAGWTAYGFTEDNRLVTERQYSEFPELYYQGFYVDLQDRVVELLFHYSTPRTVLNCSQLVLDDSSPGYFQRWGSHGWFSYTYTCTDGQVTGFVGVSKGRNEPERRFSGHVLYKEGGIVELWTKEQGQRKAKQSFRGRPPVDNPFLRSRGQ
jgi:hypothetical protein